MNIVLANQWFPPESGWGGVAVYNDAMAHALTALGHQVTVIAARTDANTPAFERREGILVHRLFVRDPYRLRRVPALGRYVRPLQQLNYSRQVDRQLRALHRQKPIDVIEFADVNAEGFFYGHRPESAVVIRCHTPTFVLRRYYRPPEMPFDTRMISWCERDAIRRATALTAPSRDMAQIIAQECLVPFERVAVIPNALPVHEFQAPSVRPNGRVTILYVGRLERAKGLAALVDAIPPVVRAVPNAHFVFAGGDRNTADLKSQRALLERELTERRVDSSVQFLGSVDPRMLQECYRQADICIVPSMLYESFSYTCAQAMAAGRPVVASRIGGIPETVGDGVHGILVTPGAADELADAIVRLARDPDLREKMGRAGSERAVAEFDALRVADLMLQVYKRAMDTFCRREG